MSYIEEVRRSNFRIFQNQSDASSAVTIKLGIVDSKKLYSDLNIIFLGAYKELETLAPLLLDGNLQAGQIVFESSQKGPLDTFFKQYCEPCHATCTQMVIDQNKGLRGVAYCRTDDNRGLCYQSSQSPSQN